MSRRSARTTFREFLGEAGLDRITALLDRARQQTGLEDFGDPGFHEGLQILVNALDREARLNETGRMAMDAQIIELLGNRLRVEDWYNRHPEIEAQEILSPLIGLGLPRTGSSALACMLGADTRYRSLRNWEAMWPCPPPEPASYDNDPRIARAEAAMQRRAENFPRMTAMLPSTAVSPTECQLFMGYAFKSQLFQAFAHIPSYTEWLNHKAAMVPCYRYVKRVLKLLQWRWPNNPRWRLKNPSHSLFITALAEVFPDARFVMTHRDVTAVLPSVADVYLELRKAFSDAVDLPAIGALTADFCALAMRRMLAFRDLGAEARFLDIHFAAFQKDPYPGIEALYAFLGEALDQAAREAMEAWRRSRPPETRNYARTDPKEFGLDPGALRARFGFYSERFGLEAANP